MYPALKHIIVLGLSLTLPWPLQPTSAQPAREDAERPREPTRADILKQIEQAGRTRPEWWDATALTYPQTLDLSWPKPAGKWNAEVNPGQYMFSVVNRRPELWRSAAKLCYQIATAQATPDFGRNQATDWLARIEGRYLCDYASAAYWWQHLQERAGQLGPNQALCLAECYWQLGSRSMAKDVLDKLDRGTVKLRGEMGPLAEALETAEAEAKRATRTEDIWIAAADACRQRGALEQAEDFYQRVAKHTDNAHFRAWAEEGQKAAQTWAALRLERLPDGTYEGSATGYRGPVTVKVSVSHGRLVDLGVVSHTEDCFGRALTDVPKQLVDRQGSSWADAVTGATRKRAGAANRPRPLVAGVDAVSGATRTSDAILNATAAALARQATASPTQKR